MALVLHHATKTQLLTTLRARFKMAQRADVWRLAAFIKQHYDAGDFTAAELRTAFNLTAGQLTTLLGKLTTYSARWAEMKAIAGE